MQALSQLSYTPVRKLFGTALKEDRIIESVSGLVKKFLNYFCKYPARRA
ncbi:MAG: hypothetical protein RIR00_2263 [Pseudomonadota bacterium]